MNKLAVINRASSILAGGLLAASAMTLSVGSAQAQNNAHPECDNCYVAVDHEGDAVYGQGVSGVSRNGEGRYSITFARSLKHCVWNATVGNTAFDRKSGKYSYTIQANAGKSSAKVGNRTIHVAIHKQIPYYYADDPTTPTVEGPFGPSGILTYYDSKGDEAPIEVEDKKASYKDGKTPWTAYPYALIAHKDAPFMLSVHCFGSHVGNVNNPKR